MMKNNIADFATRSIEEVKENIKNDQGNSFISICENVEDTKKYIAIKDIHAHTNHVVTSASKMLENYIAPFDSTVVKKLKKNGYAIVGHTNLDEYAMGSTNLTSYFGGVDNAVFAENAAGGSSGGSAYAVAKGLVPVATGTDTGGSVRQPAALNGAYGLKPTYGLISRYGTHALSSSLDSVGILGNDLEDVANLTNDLSGTDYRDQTSFTPEGFDALKSLDGDLSNLKIAKIKEWEISGINEEMREKLNEVYAYLESKGCVVEEISIPTVMYAFELYLTLGYAEASSNLNRYDGIVYGSKSNGDFKETRNSFGVEVKKRLIIGAFVLSSSHAGEYYEHSQKVRTMMDNDFKKAYEKYDLIIGPMTPNLFVSKEEKLKSREGYLSDVFAIPANLTGMPSLSAPVGKTKDGYPIGLQITANKYDEDKIFNLANIIKEFNV